MIHVDRSLGNSLIFHANAKVPATWSLVCLHFHLCLICFDSAEQTSMIDIET